MFRTTSNRTAHRGLKWECTESVLPGILLVTLLCTLAIMPAIAYEIWEFDPDIVQGFPVGDQGNAVIPGELIIDPPTLENLGFRWFIEGDGNHNATVEVAYREAGASEWREALPMLRINHEIAARYNKRHFRSPNLFAGSVFNLTPGASYELRFTMQDPDGGAPEASIYLEATTRKEAQAPDDARILHVLPQEGDSLAPPGGGLEADAALIFPDLMEAYAVAEPGDILYLHPGLHVAGSAPYILTRSGEAGRPITFRGAGAGASIIEGVDHETDLFQLLEAHHLIFEDLTLRRAHTAIRTGTQTGISIERGGPGVDGLTVRRCHIASVICGVWTSTEHSRNWHVTDNVLTGLDEVWYPRERGAYMAGSHTGVNVYGQGHVVSHNRITRFSDSLAIANYHPPLTDIHKQAVNIDFHHNDLSFAMDNTIEADYGCHNIRVYHNLNYNTHQALSIQPAYGGPIYLIRNVVFGVGTSLKWSMVPSGPVAYHNTLIADGRAFSSQVWGNGHLRNNLFMGKGVMIGTGTVTPTLSTMDYNGWYVDPEMQGQILWRTGEDELQEFGSLAEFTAATGHEQHSIKVDYGIFLRAALVERGKHYTPETFDFRLRPDSNAVNAGLRLPNINDDFTGQAPDLGAYEEGHPLPRYGPRVPIAEEAYTDLP